MSSLNDISNKKIYDAIMAKEWLEETTRKMATSEELRKFIINLIIEAPQALEGIEKTDIPLADFNRIHAMLQGRVVWYSIRELALMWGKHYITIYHWIKDGKLIAKKIGGEWRVSQEAIDAFINRRRK